MGGDASLPRQFRQPLAVGTVAAAEHDDEISTVGEQADCLLPVLGGVADVVLRRADDLWKPLPEPVDDPRGVIDRKGRLREVGESVVGAERQPVDLLRRLHERECVGRLAHRADHLVVPLVTDEHDVVAGLGVFDRLEMHLRDEWTGGVDRREPPLGRDATHLRGDAVRGEEEHGAFGHLLDAIHEHGPLADEAIDDVLVVHDLVEHVDRCAVEPDRRLEGLDRHVHAGAEAAGTGQEQFHDGGISAGMVFVATAPWRPRPTDRRFRRVAAALRYTGSGLRQAPGPSRSLPRTAS